MSSYDDATQYMVFSKQWIPVAVARCGWTRIACTQQMVKCTQNCFSMHAIVNTHLSPH